MFPQDEGFNRTRFLIEPLVLNWSLINFKESLKLYPTLIQDTKKYLKLLQTIRHNWQKCVYSSLFTKKNYTKNIKNLAFTKMYLFKNWYGNNCTMKINCIMI